MATITIPCIDSIGYLSKFYLNSGGEVAGVDDNEELLWGGIRYYVGYGKSSTEATFIGVSAYPCIFIFNPEDIKFLNNASVISAKLNIKVGYTEMYGSGNIGLKFFTTTVHPIVNNDPISEYHYVQYEVLTQANQFYSISSIEANQQIEIDLSNEISTLINLVNNGLRIQAFNEGPERSMAGIYNASSSFKPTIEIEYLSDDTPPTVSPLSPVSDVVNGDKPITFTWSYSQDVNEPQSHYSIQQQTSSGWQNLIPKTAGTAHTATVPAGTFTAGQAAWRVMVWSQNGTVASQWSDPAYIIVQSQPKAPNITSAGTSPSPTFAWQASQQQGYEIKLGDYYDAIQFGVEKSWTYPGTLPDGNVIFQIRIQNAQGIWSPWAGAETYISNVPQGTLSLSANVVNQSVSLTWTGTGFTSSQYNVYRDGELISSVSGTTFTDYYSAGKHTYQVYAMLSGGYYTPSNAITEIVRPKYAMISLVSSISWIL